MIHRRRLILELVFDIIAAPVIAFIGYTLFKGSETGFMLTFVTALVWGGVGSRKLAEWFYPR